MKNLLITHELAVSIAGKKVCNSLDIQVEEGQCWGVLGGNGVGKTTLLHTLAGQRDADGGSIEVAERPLPLWDRRSLARQIGLLPQDSSDPFPATVLETVLIGRHPHLRAWEWEDDRDLRLAHAALTAVGLEGLDQRQVSTLSGGERRRLAIASLLTQQPQLFMLDEPTNHLDLRHQIRLLELLLERQRNGAIIMTLHDVNLASRFCDHLLMLFGNGETLHGPTNIVLHEDNLTRLYDHPIRRITNGRGMAFVPC